MKIKMISKASIAGILVSVVLFFSFCFMRMNDPNVSANKLWNDVDIIQAHAPVMGKLLFIFRNGKPLFNFSFDGDNVSHIVFDADEKTIGSLVMKDGKSPYYFIIDNSFFYKDIDIDGIFDSRKAINGEFKGIDYQWHDGEWVIKDED